MNKPKYDENDQYLFTPNEEEPTASGPYDQGQSILRQEFSR